MNERQKRLIEVYEHLRKYFGIHTKTGFAEALHYGRTSLSAAMNGDDRYLSDKLFKNICELYPQTFNLDYLLNGKGQLLTIDKDKEKEIQNPLGGIDHSSLMNAALSAKDETIASLQREMRTKDELIESLRAQIEEKNDHITTLKDRLVEYRKIIDSHNGFDFPYPFRASEKPEKRQINK